MLKKGLIFIFAALYLVVVYSIFKIPDDFFQKFILKSFSSASETELAYIQGFLSTSFYDKIRWSICLSLILVVALIVLWKHYSKYFIRECKDVINWIGSSIQSFGKIQFYGILSASFILGLIVIPWIQINSDEAYAFEYFIQRNPIISLVTYPAPNNHVLYSFLASLMYRVLPFDLYAMRLPSLIAVLISFSFLLLFTFHRWGKSAAILSLLAVFCSFYPLFYAVQGRGYGILLLCTTIWIVFILKSMESRRLEKPILMCFTAIVGFYTIPVFLYPFTIGLVLLVFYVPILSLFKLGAATSIATLILYAPIMIFFGYEVLLNNEFVESLTRSSILDRFPRYFLGFLHHFIASSLLVVYVIFRGSKGLKSPILQLFLCFFLVSALIPIIHGKFPPMRVFIYIIPITTIALASILKRYKILSFLIIPLVLYSIYFARTQYFSFNQYSLEAKTILQSAVENGAERIYLLDGPRSIFNWYVQHEYPSVNFRYSLNRDSLNSELLNDTRYKFISEYRWQELEEFPYTIVDSTEYFRLFE